MCDENKWPCRHHRLTTFCNMRCVCNVAMSCKDCLCTHCRGGAVLVWWCCIVHSFLFGLIHIVTFTVLKRSHAYWNISNHKILVAYFQLIKIVRLYASYYILSHRNVLLNLFVYYTQIYLYRERISWHDITGNYSQSLTFTLIAARWMTNQTQQNNVCMHQLCAFETRLM